MAAVPVTINGVICDLYGRTITGPVKIVGELVRSDVSIGGGPIIPEPPNGGGGDGKPPFDPNLRPEHPIVLPDPPHPAHPIVLPDPPPIDPPVDPPTQPPSVSWQWVWNRSQGWHPAYVPGPTDPQPH